MRSSVRILVAIVTPLLLLSASCPDRGAGPGSSRPECTPHSAGGVSQSEHDAGPCALETGTTDGTAWTLIGAWDRQPREGSSDDGPCIDMQLSTGSGAGWCDLPEARLIGEWVEDRLTPSTFIAWGPTSAGRVGEVRIEFAVGDPLVVRPKQTPWREFDYWFATFALGRSPAALVAVDAQGKEISRETIAGRPR